MSVFRDLTRIAIALERIEVKLNQSDKVADLESVVTEFVETMENSKSTDQDWTALLVDAKKVLKKVLVDE